MPTSIASTSERLCSALITLLLNLFKSSAFTALINYGSLASAALVARSEAQRQRQQASRHCIYITQHVHAERCMYELSLC